MSQKFHRGDSLLSEKSDDLYPVKKTAKKDMKKLSNIRPRLTTRLGNMRIGHDKSNPNSISNLTGLKIEGMSFESELPAHVSKPDFTKNSEFNKSLVRHTL